MAMSLVESRAGRWTLGVLAALAAVIVVALIALALFDWNRARGWIGDQVQKRTGREFIIEGNLKVRPFSLNPRIHAEQVSLGNAPWGEDRPMVAVDTVDFSISLLALLGGRIYLPDVALGEAEVLLQRDKEGRRNWVLNPDEQKQEKGEPPQIGRLAVNRGQLTVRDVQTDTDVVLNIHTTPEEKYGVAFDAKGKAKGYRFSTKGVGGGLLSLQDQATPYPLKMTASIGKATITAEGTVTGLTALTAVDARVAISGNDIAALADALDLSFPHTAPYKLAGRLQREGQVWTYRDFTGRVGESDLRGALSVDLSSPRPTLRGKLLSRLLDISDLGGLIGEKPGQPDKKPPGKVLPSEPIDLAKLRRIDAHVSLAAQKFRNRDKLPLDDIDMKIDLVDGLLKVDPLVFGVAGGKLNSSVAVDARNKVITSDIKAAFSNLHINKLVPGTDMLDDSFGAVDGKVQLKGRGNSAAGVLGTSNGRIDLVSHGGQVSNLVMEAAGADIGEILKFFIGGDQKIELRCAVMAFNVKDGLMTSEALVVDTDDTYIGGDGTISLRDESLRLKLVPLPKDVSILSVRGPLHVRGTFDDPQIALDKATLARKIGMAIMLGLINPLAAVIPTIETGPGEGKKAPCAELIQSLEANIKGGAKKPVPQAQKKKLKENIEKK